MFPEINSRYQDTDRVKVQTNETIRRPERRTTRQTETVIWRDKIAQTEDVLIIHRSGGHRPNNMPTLTIIMTLFTFLNIMH